MAVTPTQLNQFLNQHFSLGELRTLCFELGISYEDLEGDGRAAKVLALVQYAQRHGLYDAVVTHAQAARPNARLGDMPTTTQPADTPQPTIQAPTAPIYNITVHGNLTGSAIGSSTLTAENIAGHDISIGTVPQTRDQFAEQLKQLQALLQKAIADKEIPDVRDAETLTEDLQDVVNEVQSEQPRSGRIIRRLEDMAEIIDSAGKMLETTGKLGSLIFKAAPILSGLIKGVQVLF